MLGIAWHCLALLGFTRPKKLNCFMIFKGNRFEHFGLLQLYCHSLLTILSPIMSPPTASCCCRHALRSSRCRILKQRPIIQLRNASTSYAFSRRHTISARQSQQQWRWQSTESIAPAASSDNPKIASIVDQIGQLTLLETADLVQSLKVWNTFLLLASTTQADVVYAYTSNNVSTPSDTQSFAICTH